MNIFRILIWMTLVLIHPTLSPAAPCPLKKSQRFTKTINASPSRIQSLPGYGCVPDVELSGYLPVTTHADSPPAGLFYWFVESQTPESRVPLVLWLNGGPGASSLYGFFLEHGPYVVKPDLTLEKRVFSWTQSAHYLVIDQPIGVGFSVGAPQSFLDESEAMNQLYEALQAFYSRYPELLSSPLYIAGQSYAGKYIPQLAMRILNQSDPTKRLPLKGILIGDGWVNPLIQQSADAEYAYSHGLIDEITRQKVHKLYKQCAKEIARQTPTSLQAHHLCEKMQTLIKQSSGCLHLINIGQCEESNADWMTAYLNMPAVREALHVDKNAGTYLTFSDNVSTQLMIGEQDSMAEYYPQLLEKQIKVMIYNGLLDGTDSNFMGTDRWLRALPWSKSRAFYEASTCIWRMKGSVAGFVKTAFGLTQIKIRDAGHIAPADQPAALLDLVTRFVQSQAFC
jgi:carboxypeptidase C (cathepsin A)